MLANTGTVSFVLYGIFIAIAVIGTIVAVYFIIKKGTIEAPKIDKIIELFKWVIVSVAISTVALIITDLFKEREQDVKELEYFGKYVDDVKKVDSGQIRLQLSKYLATVAPSGEMQKSWQRYYDTVKVEYQEYLRLKAEKRISDTIRNKTEQQIMKDEQNQVKITLFEQPLAAPINDIATAQVWEEKGFMFLLNKDVGNAINAFRNSENAENGYHMVYEIGRYLNDNKAKLSESNSGFWTTAYKKIVTDFSWKMPPETKSRLLQNAR